LTKTDGTFIQQHMLCSVS